MSNRKSKQSSDTSYQKPLGMRKYWWTTMVLAVLLYANTFTHDYTQDDAIVIYENMYTTDGVSGIYGLLTYDTFRGFFKTEGKAKLVSGGRYRPLTPVMFAIEYEIFGKNPFVGHLLNVMWYALLGLLIYLVLCRLLIPSMKEETAVWVALGASLLYVAHPIHTEAVANIKGRDEIMAMLGSMASIWYGLKYLDTNKLKYLVFIFITFFLGLMSKENTITFLAIWPMAVLIFKRDMFKRAMMPWLMMIVATLTFLGIRTAVLGWDMGGTPMELMNNPFLALQGNRYVPLDLGEKLATIIYTLGKYIQLLIFPHPLTHDYYPRHIEVMSFGNIQVIASVFTYVLLLIYALYAWTKKSIFSFGILYFIATLSIVSNIVFPIGTNMSERFMFMPSLGYVLILSYLILNWLREKTSLRIALSVLGLTILLYSIKTITRNMVWKDDFTLFTTDVHTSVNSAKVLNAAGGALTTEAYKLPDSPQRTEMLHSATAYLSRSLEIHPGYKNPALILGNAYYYLKDYDAAIKAYEQALSIAPDYPDAQRNLAVVLREAGQYAGEKEGNMQKAVAYLKQSLALTPTDVETIRLIGVASGMMGDHGEAIKYFRQVIETNPSKGAYGNLARALANSGDEEQAQQMFTKAAAMK